MKSRIAHLSNGAISAVFRYNAKSFPNARMSKITTTVNRQFTMREANCTSSLSSEYREECKNLIVAFLRSPSLAASMMEHIVRKTTQIPICAGSKVNLARIM